MADFIFKIQQNIVLGSYTTSRLGEFIKPWGSKFMLIIDPILRQVGSGDKIVQPLNDRKLDFFMFDNMAERADTQTVGNALKLAQQAHISGIVAVGGSKAVNIGRAVAALFNDKRDIYTALEENNLSAEPLPLVCVPSTIRDCFVFSDHIPLTDSRSSGIRLLRAPRGLCKTVMFDPNLTLTLSDNQGASMLLETLGIVLEAYLSQKSTFFSDMLAEKAMELLGYAANGTPSLDMTTPQEVLLAQGGCMASLAAASSSLGAGSLLALCLNSRFSITRALTASILLPYIIDDAAKFRLDRLAKAARILRITSADADNAKAATDLAEYVRQKIAKANLPARLKDLSLSIEQLSLAVEDAGQLELINSLPRSMTSDDLFDLVKLAY